ncbi:MAG: type I-E CRISPR-associated protein Cse1/CasA [Christensenellales bacterium]
MTLWRAGKTPKNAVPQFVPASVDPWRQMWRDFEVILGRREDTHIPGVVAWLTELRRKMSFQENMSISLLLASHMIRRKVRLRISSRIIWIFK